ncbi:MAG TPA: hypothetical protein VFZ21_00320 [Gemmatimonadaceae bacterium]|nr:hypothetical protein [Gemmatimonadaceae bacterium]
MLRIAFSSLVGSALVGLLLSSPKERAGIAIVGTGGAAALDRVTALDSATGHFIVVTRPECPGTCAALDSASGTIAPAAVARIFALIEEERLFALRDDYEVCPQCDSEVAYATTVQANGRRKVITSDGESTPGVLGRVHVAVAEAIRAARAPSD